MKILIHLLVSVIAILIATYLVPGVTITIVSAVVLAVVLGIINVFIKPIVKLITFPLNVITLGLFSLVINAVFIILASKIVPGFEVVGFMSAFWFGVALSIINAFFGLFNRE